MTNKKDHSSPGRSALAHHPTVTNLVIDLDGIREKTAGPLPLLAAPEDTAETDEPTQVLTLSERLGRTSVPPVDGLSVAPLPANVRATIEVLAGPATGSNFPLSMVATIMGRTAAIRIDDPKLSRQHAVFFYQNGDFHVRDAGSANGIYLNGARITDYRLCDGDKLLLGDTTVLFRVSR
jgi:hypothetical protein